MAENFNETVGALFKGMDSFISAKTVVGDAVKFDDGTIIVPFVDVSFGVGAGAFSQTAKNSAGGGMGGKVTANSVLVLQDGKARLVNIKNQDTVTRVLDAIPEVVDRIKKTAKDKDQEGEMDRKGKDYLNKHSKEK